MSIGTDVTTLFYILNNSLATEIAITWQTAQGDTREERGLLHDAHAAVTAEMDLIGIHRSDAPDPPVPIPVGSIQRITSATGEEIWHRTPAV